MHAFEMWEEAEVPGENPHRQREHMRTPHSKACKTEIRTGDICTNVHPFVSASVCLKIFSVSMRRADINDLAGIFHVMAFVLCIACVLILNCLLFTSGFV